MKKRMLSLVAAGLVVCMAAGCNGKKSSVKEVKTYGDYPINTNETLTLWSSLHANVAASATNLGETEFAKELEKETGIKINYIHPAIGKESENFSLMIASGELPDMVQHNWQAAHGGPAGMIEDEVILPLNDLIDKNAPNLKAYLKEHPDISRVIKTDDGQYYVFPFIRGDKSLLISAGPIIRKDWLDELGLSTPETIDDWEKMLYAFKTKKGASAPLSVSPSTSSYLYYIFNATPDFYIDNGKVKFGCMEPEFKEAVTKLHQWFDEGLIDKNYISADASMNTYNILNGEAGATFGGGGGDLGKWLETMKDKGGSFDLIGVKFPSKDGKECAFAPFNDYYAPHASVAITTNCKNPSLAAKWLDYGYGEKGHMLNNFGIEGESYKMVDGYPKYTEIITNNPDGLTLGQAMSRYMRSCYSGAFVQDKRYIEQYYSLEQQKHALGEWLKSYDETMKKKMPQVTISPEESTDYANIYSEIVKYRNERITAFILGNVSLDKYDEYLETMKGLKSDKVIEIQQNAYDRFMKR